MEIPLQITAYDFRLTPTVMSKIREKATKLDTICDRIIRCRVVNRQEDNRHGATHPLRRGRRRVVAARTPLSLAV